MPESYEKVTVYFSDIVGFSAICHESQPLEVVQMLNDLYIMFDQIVDEFDVYKVKSILNNYWNSENISKKINGQKWVFQFT